MARLMCTQNIENKRILEVGCGIGLSSLVLNKRNADITATDYHPEAKVFLEKNVLLNESKEISFIVCDWKDDNFELGEFDLIIGSDLLYEQDHAALLSSFISRHISDEGEVIIVCPNRGYQNKFNQEMERLSFEHNKVRPAVLGPQEVSFNGYIHTYKRSKVI